MKYYVGIDLHSNNSYIGIIDQDGRTIFKKRTINDLNTIKETLKVFKKSVKGIVVESTFNWYWLVDGLQEEGFKIHLANPAKMKQYEGLKYVDDQSDALWLAETLRLKILPEGYIYPKEMRAVRDLLRKRMFLVKHRTSILLSMKGMIHNWTGERISRGDIKALELNIKFSNVHNTIAVDSMNNVIKSLNKEIKRIEEIVLKEVKLKKEFKKLLKVWGIGPILGITIMLETDNIKRFGKVGNYTFYCRCAPSEKISNEKKKGTGNRRNGNQYLAWAYVEAAYHMQRHYLKAKKWYQRKSAKKGSVVAMKALSNKISRACYFVMKDQTDFNPNKLFA